MEKEIIWTLQAENGLNKVIEYLEKEWSVKEILRLEEKINQVVRQIILNPELFPRTEKYLDLHKVIIDKNNYMVYRLHLNRIEIINFRGNKQKRKH